MTRWIKALLSVFVLLVLVLGVAFYQWQAQIRQPLALTEDQLVTLPVGTSGHRAAELLSRNHWLKAHPLAVRVWLKLQFSSRPIKAGTYQLKPGMTLEDAFELFASGQEFQFTVTLVEGLTWIQWLDTLQAHPYLENDMTDQRAAELLAEWPWPPEGGLTALEGVLLADTYHFTAGTRVSDLVLRAMNAMQTLLDSQWQQRAIGLPLASPYQALILASIVEKETAVAQERARIAAVFVNRLERNMRLQTDPTVIYGLGSDFDGNLTRAHLRQKTAYNTYVLKGLPPTPIAMAGTPAIEAVLHPLQTEELYFVSRGDGSHQFSVTLEEHNRAVYQYQIKKEKTQQP